MYKKCKIIRIPTGKASIGSIRIKEGFLSINDNYLTQDYIRHIGAVSYHIYVLSDEKINPGDFFVTDTKKSAMVFRYDPNSEYIKESVPRSRELPEDAQKLIGSSNKDIGNPRYAREEGDVYECLNCGTKNIKRNAYATWFSPCKCNPVPRIPYQFTEEYCRRGGFEYAFIEYNEVGVYRGKKITMILAKSPHNNETNADMSVYEPSSPKIEFNCIVIKPPRLFTREQVIEIAKKYASQTFFAGDAVNSETWFEKNLEY